MCQALQIARSEYILWATWHTADRDTYTVPYMVDSRHVSP